VLAYKSIISPYCLIIHSSDLNSQPWRASYLLTALDGAKGIPMISDSCDFSDMILGIVLRDICWIIVAKYCFNVC